MFNYSFGSSGFSLDISLDGIRLLMCISLVLAVYFAGKAAYKWFLRRINF